MSLVISYNETIQNILSEIQELDNLEQKAILAWIRARKLKETKKGALNKSSLPPLSDEKIDAIKHKARK